ncbi:4-hydroxy-3-methylbut-2-enyl diphosphate reductase [Candidatus Margulisiibacteriota bacterium]
MKILVAKHLGFCVGVNRAYKLAIRSAVKKLPVFMLGALVHNQKVIEHLEIKGIKTINTLKDVPKDQKGYLIISAHGLPPKILEQLEGTKLNVIDTTCPWVKKAQIIAKKLAKDGYHVVIVGDKEHIEVKGLLGWAGKKAQVVENIKDLKKVNFHKKMGVLAQTTQTQLNFEEMVGGLYNKTEELVVHNTICDATKNRQKFATVVAKRSEIMFIIGDKKSANTRRLTKLCGETGVKTYQVESAEDIDLKWLKGFDVIGVTAGASTPTWVIDAAVKKLKGHS